MKNTRSKALYVFLSSILGMLLFTMFHRSLFVIYEILGNFYMDVSLLHVPFRTMALLDFGTFLLALFLGGWYGVWMGLCWYKIIYEDREVKTWFHGFVPHHWRNHKSKTVETKSVPRRIVVNAQPATTKVESFQNFRADSNASIWDVDDISSETKKPARKVAKKRVVKKVVRKTIAKKKVTV